jgi:hypothetical protein
MVCDHAANREEDYADKHQIVAREHHGLLIFSGYSTNKETKRFLFDAIRTVPVILYIWFAF